MYSNAQNWPQVMDYCPEIRMTGEEKYKIVGDLITEEDSKILIKKFKGLCLYADCLEKAKIVKRYLNEVKRINALNVLGKMYISYDGCIYGFEYNPPLEFHAFVVVGNCVVDLSLPGVIMRAQQHRDEEGQWFAGLKPFILAGNDIPKGVSIHYSVFRTFF